MVIDLVIFRIDSIRRFQSSEDQTKATAVQHAWSRVGGAQHNRTRPFLRNRSPKRRLSHTIDIKVLIHNHPPTFYTHFQKLN
ncbi:hypothetical protein G7K_6416-t1 [Saitoella complicata NRRL Y-17804]|uniref:Uncharacterized protein n=1 Tax=Saitoella complicata (strain BCRC 22490 / CBS 7301 / JCM 7358 / NBRC 10748 / NRRL Y-17804) TaxID=698492 RepID=A0A0E9NR28_SAICN|nr:hypothetical protein G7K_6416-t1 [Saitoella complicata NRRL Y-17804]